MNSGGETVTISKDEYEELVEDSRFLDCLLGAGVDSWEGWDIAHELMEAYSES